MSQFFVKKIKNIYILESIIAYLSLRIIKINHFYRKNQLITDLNIKRILI